MDIEKRLELVKRNTVEIITEAELRKLLEGKKRPVIYWGTAITGTPHVGYFFPILKLADFLKAGFKVKVLLADLHGALDNTPWPVLEKRYNYYEKVIPLMFKVLGVKESVEFIKGSDFQLKPEYSYDLLRLSTITSIRGSKKAASEVVKFGKNPKLGGLIYPIMQALDEVYLNADAQFAGLDQRKIMVFARESLPKIGYDARVEIMIPMIPGLIGKKMSASEEKSKIDLLDDNEEVERKVKGAEMVAGNPNNGVMAFLRYVLMTIKQDKNEKFIIKRDEKYGGDLVYENYKKIERDFRAKKLHPLDLKISVAREINKLLKVVRENKRVLEKLRRDAFHKV